jgi:contractile injection system tube protein/LysM domain-containing protein
MPLTKLRINNQDNSKSFEVLFNPTMLTIDDGSQWKEQPKPRFKPELQYTGWQLRSISMELFFDTYEAGTDVRQLTGQFAQLLIPTINDGGQGKRPPKVKLIWGAGDPLQASGLTTLDWILEKLNQKFTMFTGDGTPVRATLNVTFKEFIPPKKVNQQNPRRRSFPEKTYTVKAGDTLEGIAAALWKDPQKWRVIAESNGIDNPRLLDVGATLNIPAID